MSETQPISIDDIPQIGLKDTIKNLKVLASGVDGSSCLRCGEAEYWKGGKNKSTNGQVLPRRICCNCGYAYSFVDVKKDFISRNRAARVFNLEDKKFDTILEDSIQFGLIKKDGDLYSLTHKCKNNAGLDNLDLYHNIPIYHHLIESLGANPKRSDFEKSLDLFLNGDHISTIKRNVLWRRYQEIASDIFICGKSCKFSRTCKKNHTERKNCDIVKKAKDKKKEWRVDVVL